MLNMNNQEDQIERELHPGGHNPVLHPAIVPCQIVASSVAAFLCLIIILAITIPLFKKRQPRNGSTYNLYLVFLVIPELISNSGLVYTFATLRNWIYVLQQKLESATANDVMSNDTDVTSVVYNQTLSEDMALSATEEEHSKYTLPLYYHRLGYAIFAGCMYANLYLNAVIVFEILKLLRDSKSRKRSKSPTLLRATIQALVVYSLGLTLCMVNYFYLHVLLSWPFWALASYTLLLTGLPIGYMVWVCFRICCEGLLSYNTATGNRLKVLVRYFSRIVILNVCSFLIINLSTIALLGSALPVYLTMAFYAIQVWIGFGLTLTKPDVRRNVFELFTCQVCSQQKSNDKKMTHSQDSKAKSIATRKTKKMSIDSDIYHDSGSDSANELQCDDAISHWFELEEECNSTPIVNDPSDDV